jgi:hypothetical protein
MKKQTQKPKVVAKKPTPKPKEPTYKNLKMGVALENQEMTGQYTVTKPNKRDSMAYKAGYNIGLRGEGGGLNERPLVRMGRWEGQNVKSKATPKKK